tara:strand:+ start:179 stop:571 length:393 start_codon:yes stop_codon:yes gene_type:complete
MAATSSLYGGGVKSVQAGVYSGAGGTVTISAVVVAKSVISTVSKSSAGTVAATGSTSGTLSPSTGIVSPGGYYSSNYDYTKQTYSVSYTGTRTLSGGTTSLTTKQYSAVITNSTTITADGPCEWQVVEYS